MARRGDKLLVAAAALLLGLAGGPLGLAGGLFGLSSASAQAPPPDQVNTIRDIFVRLGHCWKPPPASKARPIDITVVVSFNRAGEILGHPRITFESPEASDSDRLEYRKAVMEALQRCTPMPFTETMAGATAGRPFAIQFHGRKTSPQATERKA